MTEYRLYITASADTLIGQASKTAQEFLREAMAAVREELGTKTPEKLLSSWLLSSTPLLVTVLPRSRPRSHSKMLKNTRKPWTRS